MRMTTLFVMIVCVLLAIVALPWIIAVVQFFFYVGATLFIAFFIYVAIMFIFGFFRG